MKQGNSDLQFWSPEEPTCVCFGGSPFPKQTQYCFNSVQTLFGNKRLSTIYLYGDMCSYFLPIRWVGKD